MADFSRLPGPNADLWDWQLRGLCRGKDSSLFFHPEGERGAARSSRETAAKEICMNCPVQISCADHALRVREPYGVWGGMTEEEREEHHVRQKALARAQAAREKAARLRQEQMKEKLLRDKAAENRRKEQAGAAARAGATVDAGPVTPVARAGATASGPATRTATAAPATKTGSGAPVGKTGPASPVSKRPTGRKKSKALVEA